MVQTTPLSNRVLEYSISSLGREVQNGVIMPTTFSTEHDRELLNITEGRIACMQHELVPDYLRTKLDLDIEKEHKRLQDVRVYN